MIERTISASRTPARPNAEAIQDALGKFEHRLGERTRVPPNKLSEFMEWPEEKLKRESKSVTHTLKRFAEAVVDSMEEPQSADTFLRELDLRSISRDHDWRAIFSTIRAQEAGYEGYKRAVLIKYLQYLSFRKRLIEYCCASRRGLEDTEEYSDLSMMALRLGADKESSYDEFGRAMDPNFVRLPLGESVDIEVSHARQISFMMAAHVFRLHGGSSPMVVDQNGVTYVLKQGRNMVGRHPEGDLVVDPNFSDISRAHLIIEFEGPHRVRLIDFSSRGTFVHREAFEQPSECPTLPGDSVP